jgi:nucleotide-binding universal stress UspA family protein
MIEIRRILCPIDFSDYSRHALDHAVAIARWYESTITVLHTFSTAPVAAYAPGTPGFPAVVLTGADRDELLAQMKKFIEPEAAPGVAIEPVIREGHPAGEILSQAAEMSADLIVLGSHGRSGFDRLLLGSVTEKVLHKAGCPVLTVPRRHPDAVPAPPVLFKRILCAVDFSDCSMRGLAYAMSLAEEADAQLTVAHVIAPDLEDTPDLYGSMAIDEGWSLADYRQRREDEARRRLAEAVPDDVKSFCSVETISVPGKPALEILRLASDRQSELIVLGVRGRGAADLLLFGSTTNRVVRASICPVLTLCGPGDAPPAP